MMICNKFDGMSRTTNELTCLKLRGRSYSVWSDFKEATPPLPSNHQFLLESILCDPRANMIRIKPSHLSYRLIRISRWISSNIIKFEQFDPVLCMNQRMKKQALDLQGLIQGHQFGVPEPRNARRLKHCVTSSVNEGQRQTCF